MNTDPDILRHALAKVHPSERVNFLMEQLEPFYERAAQGSYRLQSYVDAERVTVVMNGLGLSWKTTAVTFVPSHLFEKPRWMTKGTHTKLLADTGMHKGLMPALVYALDTDLLPKVYTAIQKKIGRSWRAAIVDTFNVSLGKKLESGFTGIARFITGERVLSCLLIGLISATSDQATEAVLKPFFKLLLDVVPLGWKRDEPERLCVLAA
ncbi:MAG: hypothetical protein ABIO72_03730 [Patescibacteria group bacterium]